MYGGRLIAILCCAFQALTLAARAEGPVDPKAASSTPLLRGYMPRGRGTNKAIVSQITTYLFGLAFRANRGG